MFRLFLFALILSLSSRAALAECPYTKDEFDALREQAQAGDEKLLQRLKEECGYFPATGKIAQDRKEAESGSALAQYNVAKYYFSKSGPKPDYVAAMKWFRKSADQNYVYAQIKIGEMYRDGLGVPKNNAKAKEWFDRAIANRGTLAMFYIARDYDRWGCSNGDMLKCDPIEAEKWYLLAADHGSRDAQRHVVGFYKNLPEITEKWSYETTYSLSQEERAKIFDFYVRQSPERLQEAYYWQMILRKSLEQYPNLALNDEPADICPVGEDGCSRHRDNTRLLKELRKELGDEQAVAVLKKVEAWRPKNASGVLSTDEVVKNFLVAQDRQDGSGGAAVVDKFILSLVGIPWLGKSEVILLWKQRGHAHPNYYLTVFEDVGGGFKPAGTLALREPAQNIFAAGQGAIGIYHVAPTENDPAPQKKLKVYHWRDGTISEGDARDIEYIGECEKQQQAEETYGPKLPHRIMR